jgi:hypothetical protein
MPSHSPLSVAQFYCHPVKIGDFSTATNRKSKQLSYTQRRWRTCSGALLLRRRNETVWQPLRVNNSGRRPVQQRRCLIRGSVAGPGRLRPSWRPALCK